MRAGPEGGGKLDGGGGGGGVTVTAGGLLRTVGDVVSELPHPVAISRTIATAQLVMIFLISSSVLVEGAS